MTVNEEIFRQFVSRLESTEDKNVSRRMDHAIIGLNTETGELLGELKKAGFYRPDGQYNIKKVEDEACDTFHYLIMLCNALGISLNFLIELNMAKLNCRYPDGYTSGNALNKDEEAEEQAMDIIREKYGRL